MLKKENFFLRQGGCNAPQQQRKFFNDLANSKQFDPLDAQKWYSILPREILKAGGGGILKYYNGSHIKALTTLYPELKLKREFFFTFQGWKAPNGRRNFFDDFAKSRQFNPLNAENWYSISHREILRAGGGGILLYYKGSYIRALVELYPEVKLESRNFFHSKASQQQRKFFDNFAKSKQFDPLDARKWYSITEKEIVQAGGRGIVKYYKGSSIIALIELYPELLLKKENFLHIQWRSKRRTNTIPS